RSAAERARPAVAGDAGERPRPAKTVVVLGSVARSLVNFRGPMLQAMALHGHRVIACAPDAAPSIVQTLAGLGVGYRDVPIDAQGLRPWRDLRALRALVRLLRELRPDAVLGYTIKPVIYGSIAARLARVPASYSMITGLGYAFGGSGAKRGLVALLARALYRISVRRNRRVFFQNRDDRAVFERLGLTRGPDQAVMINGSGVDLDHFRPRPLPEQMAFLLIARLLREKGVPEFVAAARLVRQRHPDVRFRVVGRFDHNPSALAPAEMERWVAAGAIEFLGELDDVRPAIAASSVFVLPSYYREGTPRTVLEAMSMGRPIITTDVPGCRETVHAGVNGYLVPARDVAALARAMLKFIEVPERVARMGAASRRIAEERYDVHKVNAVILKAMDLS
ncbi:MAG TPA: glycosyltransferase family 4 protein, partial [Geminicoccaceae bacterium]